MSKTYQTHNAHQNRLTFPLSKNISHTEHRVKCNLRVHKSYLKYCELLCNAMCESPTTSSSSGEQETEVTTPQ